MKFRLGIVLLLVVVGAAPVHAGPKKIFKAIGKAAVNHITLDIEAGLSSGYASGGTFYCRQHNPDVEHCTAHYGSANITEVARAGFTVGMIALSEYGRKQHFKEWFVPVVGTTAFNVFWGTREFRTHEKRIE